MNDPNQPPSSRDPRPPPTEDPAQQVAKGAALGCFAGLGAVGAVIATVLLALGAVAAVGVLLIYLACSGH